MLESIFNNFETFLFVFIRVMTIFVMIPFLGGRSVPLQLRISIALMIAVVITPVLGVTAALPDSALGIAFSIGQELIVGIMIGLAAKLVFASFEMAGQLAGMQMGFSMANVLDPQTSSQLSVMAQFYNILAIFLFFTLDIHLIFISAMVESFNIIPPYGVKLSGYVFQGILDMSTDLFVVALKLAAPISVAVLLANLGMGIIARTVPQLNVFVVGFPITIGVGLLVFFFSVSFFSSTISNVYADLSNNLFDLIRISGQ